MAMDLRTKCHHLVLVVIKRLRVYGLKCKFRAFILLILLLVSIPWLQSTIRREFESMVHNNQEDRDLVELKNDNSIELEILPLLVRNLTDEGLLGFQDKGLIVNNNNDQNEKLVGVLRNKMDLIPYLDLEKIQEHNYDFAFTHESNELVDKVLKINGIMIVQKKGSIKDSQPFQKPLNYEILYFKELEPRFDTTIITMKKTRMVDDNNNNELEAGNTNIPHRRLMFEQKKAEAIKNLENVLLEPPRTSSGKPITFLKKTRYLPDLMDDSLDDFPRRVFIDVNGDTGWFTKNYPTRNKNFHIYQVETSIPATDDQMNDDEVDQGGASMETEMADWLRENVQKDEYVVMKGEADLVEDLMKSKAIELVDELFLECKYQGKKCEKCRRPYWKCLALYGQLKDAGVAVHQWWG